MTFFYAQIISYCILWLWRRILSDSLGGTSTSEHTYTRMTESTVLKTGKQHTVNVIFMHDYSRHEQITNTDMAPSHRMHRLRENDAAASAFVRHHKANATNPIMKRMLMMVTIITMMTMITMDDDDDDVWGYWRAISHERKLRLKLYVIDGCMIENARVLVHEQHYLGAYYRSASSSAFEWLRIVGRCWCSSIDMQHAMQIARIVGYNNEHEMQWVDACDANARNLNHITEPVGCC